MHLPRNFQTLDTDPTTYAPLAKWAKEVFSPEFERRVNAAPGYLVAPYIDSMAALKEKLAQFRSETHLDLITTTAELERHRAEFAEVENAAASDGLTLQVQTPR